VAYDSQGRGSFVVTKPDGKVFEFKASKGGLYFLNTDSAVTVLVNTVAENKVNYRRGPALGGTFCDIFHDFLRSRFLL
jgi:ribosomal protein L24E